MTVLKIPYAFKDISKELVNINEVDEGKDCKCYCVRCGNDLIAKKNKLKRPYFIHEDRELNCDSHETFLHFLVEKVFKVGDGIYIPKLLIQESFEGANEQFEAFNEELIIKRVELNKYLNSTDSSIFIKVDYNNIEETFIFDFALTSSINEDQGKVERIRKANLNYVEIDFLNIRGRYALWNVEFIKKELKKKKRYALISQGIYNEGLEKERLIEKHYSKSDKVREACSELRDELIGKTLTIPSCYAYHIIQKGDNKIYSKKKKSPFYFNYIQKEIRKEIFKDSYELQVDRAEILKDGHNIFLIGNRKKKLVIYFHRCKTLFDRELISQIRKDYDVLCVQIKDLNKKTIEESMKDLDNIRWMYVDKTSVLSD